MTVRWRDTTRSAIDGEHERRQVAVVGQRGERSQHVVHDADHDRRHERHGDRPQPGYQRGG